MFRKAGERLGIATILNGLASAAATAGERDLAAAYAIEALELNRHMGHCKGIATTQHVLARIARGDGDDDRVWRTRPHGAERLPQAWLPARSHVLLRRARRTQPSAQQSGRGRPAARLGIRVAGSDRRSGAAS